MRYKTNSKAHQLRREGLAKVRYVLQEIKAKRLNHKQGTWHCGTAHCVFGWVDMFEAMQVMPLEDIIKINLDEIAEESDDYYNDVLTVNGHKFHLEEGTLFAWYRKYKFSEDDARSEELLIAIYEGTATLKTQFAALEKLEIYLFGEEQVVTENPFEVTTQQQKNFQELMFALNQQEEPMCETELEVCEVEHETTSTRRF